MGGMKGCLDVMLEHLFEAFHDDGIQWANSQRMNMSYLELV